MKDFYSSLLWTWNGNHFYGNPFSLFFFCYQPSVTSMNDMLPFHGILISFSMNLSRDYTQLNILRKLLFPHDILCSFDQICEINITVVIFNVRKHTNTHTADAHTHIEENSEVWWNSNVLCLYQSKSK